MSSPHRLVRAACAFAALVPALSMAQGVFDMGALTNSLSQGANINHERERAIRMGKGDPLPTWRRPGGRGSRSHPKANPAVLLYRPSLAARQRNMEAFVARIEAADPASAASLRRDMAKGDLIVRATPVLKAIGADPNNVADAMAMYLVVAWHGARGDDKETKAEFRGVRGQLARAVAGNPAMARVTDAVKQQTAETMILNALLTDASVTDAMKNPERLAGVRTTVAQSARRTFGFDVTRLRLGANGFY